MYKDPWGRTYPNMKISDIQLAKDYFFIEDAIERLNPLTKAPNTLLPTDYKARKDTPIGTGVIDYFPKALAEVARCSKVGNDQHNPGKPLHWDRSKSTDEADALIRHFIERGTVDVDGIRHSAKVAWRALALLEKELENA